MELASQLLIALKQAGLAVESVSIVSADKSTWLVQPASLQAAAQPVIDAFVPDAVTVLEAEAKRVLDQERLISAVVWTVIDTYSAPATKAKYTAARTKLIEAFKSQPWKS